MQAMQACQAGGCLRGGPASPPSPLAREVHHRPRPFTRRRPECSVVGAGNGAFPEGRRDVGSSPAAAAGASALPSSSNGSVAAAAGPSSSNGTSAAAAAASGGLEQRQQQPACSTAGRPAAPWQPKSEIILLRSDGYSCTRETVQRECCVAGGTRASGREESRATHRAASEGVRLHLLTPPSPRHASSACSKRQPAVCLPQLAAAAAGVEDAAQAVSPPLPEGGRPPPLPSRCGPPLFPPAACRRSPRLNHPLHIAPPFPTSPSTPRPPTPHAHSHTCSVAVLKKLGDELMDEYIDVLRYLGEELGVGVVVEPHDYAVLVRGLRGLCMRVWVWGGGALGGALGGEGGGGGGGVLRLCVWWGWGWRGGGREMRGWRCVERARVDFVDGLQPLSGGVAAGGG